MITSGTVETQHLPLRPVIEEDAGSVWLLHSDARTNIYNPAGPMTDRKTQGLAKLSGEGCAFVLIARQTASARRTCSSARVMTQPVKLSSPSSNTAYPVRFA